MYYLPTGLPPAQQTLAAILALALCVVFGEASSDAFVYGSGMIPITNMVRSGIDFDNIGIILIVLLIPVMATLTGLA